MVVDDSAVHVVHAGKGGSAGRIVQGAVKLAFASPDAYATNGVPLGSAVMEAAGAKSAKDIKVASVADISDLTLVGYFDRVNQKLKLCDIADGAEVTNATSLDGLVVTLAVLRAA